MKAKRKAMREAEAQARYKKHELKPWEYEGQTATSNCVLCGEYPVVVRARVGMPPSFTKPEYPRGRDTFCPIGMHAAAKRALPSGKKAGVV